MKMLGKINVDGREVDLLLARYSMSRKVVPAIQAFSTDSDGVPCPYGRLSVNPADGPAAVPWTVHVLTQEENEGLAVAAERSGYFEDLQRPLRQGGKVAQLWRIIPERAQLAALAYAMSDLRWPVTPMQVVESAARNLHGVESITLVVGKHGPAPLSIGLGVDALGGLSMKALHSDVHAPTRDLTRGEMEAEVGPALERGVFTLVCSAGTVDFTGSDFEASVGAAADMVECVARDVAREKESSSEGAAARERQR